MHPQWKRTQFQCLQEGFYAAYKHKRAQAKRHRQVPGRRNPRAHRLSGNCFCLQHVWRLIGLINAASPTQMGLDRISYYSVVPAPSAFSIQEAPRRRKISRNFNFDKFGQVNNFWQIQSPPKPNKPACLRGLFCKWDAPLRKRLVPAEFTGYYLCFRVERRLCCMRAVKGAKIVWKLCETLNVSPAHLLENQSLRTVARFACILLTFNGVIYPQYL